MLLRALLLLAMGCYMAYLGFSGDLGNYVNIRFIWIAAIGAALLLLLGGYNLSAYRTMRHSEHAVEHDPAHRHRPTQWPALGILAVPLGLGLLVPSEPLGAAAVSGDISFGERVTEVATIAPSDSLQWSVLDWLRATSLGGRDRVDGKAADVTGFVYRRDGDPADHFLISRFLMVHCTADAYPIGMPVNWAGASALPADSWVRVCGAVGVADFGGSVLPIVRADSIDERVDRPAQVYLYP